MPFHLQVPVVKPLSLSLHIANPKDISGNSVSKVVANEKEEELAAGIGRTGFNVKELRLKPAREKRVMLRISNKVPYTDVRSKAEAKFNAYHSNFYKKSDQYHSLYE